MALAYKLAGFDRQSELLVEGHVLPAASIEQAKLIADIAARPEIIGDWPLSATQARNIAEIAGIIIDPDRFDCFLEPYSAVALDRTTA